MDASARPSEQSLQVALRSADGAYRTLLELAGSFVQEWTFSKSSGWMLKIHDRKKALLYLIPLNREFKVSLAIRESERDTFLRDGDLTGLHEQISSARKYSEGFALQFEIAGDPDFGPVELFIRKLIAERA